MYRGALVGVVIPVYNEEPLIGDVIDTVPSFVDAIYVVDDCSTDGTWAKIEQKVTVHGVTAEEPGPALVPIRHRHNRGRGGAVKTGYLTALADGMDAVVVIDGDGQMDPAALDSILDPVVQGEVDYVVGDRLSNRDSRKEIPPFRLFGNFVLTGLTRVVSGYWSLSDPQSGYTAISRAALESLDIDACYEGYGFLNDILARLNALGFEMRNVEVPARYGDEESGIRYSSFIPRVSFLLYRLFLLRVFVWRFNPPSGSSAGIEFGEAVTRRRASFLVEEDLTRPTVPREEGIADGGDDRPVRRERI